VALVPSLPERVPVSSAGAGGRGDPDDANVKRDILRCRRFWDIRPGAASRCPAAPSLCRRGHGMEL
jgi:hypothetical protein